jgi:putative nucleotidyltransferase with HDIG domain
MMNADFAKIIVFEGLNIPIPEYVFEHCKRVELLSYNLAKSMGLIEDECQKIKTVGLYHDAGKAYMPIEILNKPSCLSKEEYEIIQNHPRYTYMVLKSKGIPEDICKIAMLHHEKYSGMGYPLGLKGEEIPLGARIVQICDIFDAMTNSRPYQRTLSIEETLKEMHKNFKDIDLKIFRKFYGLVGARI